MINVITKIKMDRELHIEFSSPDFMTVNSFVKVSYNSEISLYKVESLYSCGQGLYHYSAIQYGQSWRDYLLDNEGFHPLLLLNSPVEKATNAQAWRYLVQRLFNWQQDVK